MSIVHLTTLVAIAIDLSREGLGEKVLLRSDGTAVYITQDLGIAGLVQTLRC